MRLGLILTTYPGILITFEGDDGVGKSTHIALLAERLLSCGLDVICLREPGGTKIGEDLRNIVLDASNEGMSPECELLIYEAARAQLVHEVITPALSAGKVVLCDRFTDSTIAYQACGRGLSKPFVEEANSFATGGLVPDMTILLYVSNESELGQRMDERASFDRIELADTQFHSNVSRAFRELPEVYPDRIVAIESSGEVNRTSSAIAEAVFSRFPELSRG